VVKVCREARQYNFASVCVNPYWVPLVKAELAGSPVKVCTVVGFSAGRHQHGGQGCGDAGGAARGGPGNRHGDQRGRLRGGENEAVRQDIHEVVKATHAAGAIVKVILETALLDDNQKAIASTLSKLAGADFVKTSTGFGPSGATAHDVALMRSVVGPDMGIKAAGGNDAGGLAVHDGGGATRIGPAPA